MKIQLTGLGACALNSIEQHLNQKAVLQVYFVSNKGHKGETQDTGFHWYWKSIN